MIIPHKYRAYLVDITGELVASSDLHQGKQIVRVIRSHGHEEDLTNRQRLTDQQWFTA